jgi:hypothetical protein
MSDELVEVPFENARDQAVLLLAAAQEQGLDPSVVRTTVHGFLVPATLRDQALTGDVAKKAEEKRESVQTPRPAPTGAGPTGATDTNSEVQFEEPDEPRSGGRRAKKAASDKQSQE